MPEAMHIPALQEVDEEQMAALTAQESFSIEGQIRKMAMVGGFIRDRYERARQQALISLGDTSDLSSEMQDVRVNALVQPLEFERIDVGDGRFNLIVSKGLKYEIKDGEPVRVPPRYSVMIPAHVDTVIDKKPRLELRTQGDKWEGLGVYDMGAAVLNGIALAVDTKVPDGMEVHFVFTPDEEMHSRGARQLMQKWVRWPEIDCVLSSEIGPIPPLKSGDKHMRLITGRSGRQKFVGNITINPQHQGHGAQEGIPNASDALIELLSALRGAFFSGYRDPRQVNAEFIKPFQRSHSLLGVENFETGKLVTHQREGYFPPHAADFSFSMRTVPPTTLEGMLRQLMEVARRVAKQGDWTRFGIGYTLGQNPEVASYSPYSMPPSHQLVQVANDVLTRVAGEIPHPVGAKSVADECDYAAGILQLAGKTSFEDLLDKGVINIPINGDLAHHPGEWVSRMDIARVRFATKMLLEDPLGLSRLMRDK
jgi:acetylornithine deacetylase/succinyl-diaminopimelate desuccinylase-like protein